MAELTIEDYKRGARNAVAAGDNEAAKRLIAKARELDGSSQTETTDQAQAQTPDTSLLGAISQGIDQSGAMIGKGIQSGGELASDLGAEGIGDYLQTSGAEMAARNEAQIEASNYQRPEGADGIISNLKEGDFANAGTSLLYGAAEAAPQVAGGVVASVGAGLAATSAPVIGTAAAIGGTIYGTVNALGQMRDEKETQGLDPKATASDLGAAIASGLVELTPIKGGGASLRVIRETVQEGVQEGLVIGNTTVQGGEYVPEEVVNRIGDAAITGGALSKAVSTAITTVNKTGDVVLRKSEDLDPEVDQAAGDVSRMLTEIAETEGYNLKNVAPTTGSKGANDALNAARGKLNADIATAVKDLRTNVLKGADEAIVSQFNSAVRQANNKVSEVVTKENIAFIKDNFGTTSAGQSLVQSFRKSNVVTELYAGGLKGGVSQFTDQFNPLPTFGRSYNPAGVLTGNLGAGAAVLTGGSSLTAQLPLLVGGRAIDAVTGRRSKVARFVKKNKNKAGLGAVGGADIRGMAQARKDMETARKLKEKEKVKAKKDAIDEKKAALYARQYTKGERPHPKSPRGFMHAAYRETYVESGGKSKTKYKDIDQEIDSTVDELLNEAINLGDTDTVRSLEDYKTILRTGRAGQDGELNVAIQKVMTRINEKVTSGPQQKSGGVKPNQAPKESGKQGNIEFRKELEAAMNADKSVSPSDRAVLTKAFSDLGKNLGSDPLAKMASIVDTALEGLQTPQLATTYLRPYVDRVTQQQKSAKAKGKKAKNGPKDPEPTAPAAKPTKADGPNKQGDGGQPTGPQPQFGPPQPPAPILNAPTKASVKKPTVVKIADKVPPVPVAKKQIPEAKAIIEIGKKGTKYENGIQDIETAERVAEVLGIAFNMMSSGTALQKRTGQGLGTRAVHLWRDGTKGFGSSIFAIKAGGSYEGQNMSSLESLMDTLHEMSHSLTQGNLDGEGPFGTKIIKNKLRNSKQEKLGAHSFNATALAPLIQQFGVDHPVIQEIHAFQEGGKAYLASNPNDTVDPRQLREFLANLATANSDPQKYGQKKIDELKDQIKRVKDYTNLTAELSVDPMWLYLMNPKLAKQLMPKTTELIRTEFAKGGNKKIQFYSHPLATVLAVFAAITGLSLKTEGEEEEEMPQGILSV